MSHYYDLMSISNFFKKIFYNILQNLTYLIAQICVMALNANK